MLESFLVGLASNYVAAASIEAIRRGAAYLVKQRPDLEARFTGAQKSGDQVAAQKILEEGFGVLLAEAAAGKITLDGALVSALRKIHFDHQDGTVWIEGSKVRAPILTTGGTSGATGTTHIGGNTRLQSRGTSIEVGHGASIQISGGASIKQT